MLFRVCYTIPGSYPFRKGKVRGLLKWVIKELGYDSIEKLKPRTWHSVKVGVRSKRGNENI